MRNARFEPICQAPEACGARAHAAGQAFTYHKRDIEPREAYVRKCPHCPKRFQPLGGACDAIEDA